MADEPEMPEMFGVTPGGNVPTFQGSATQLLGDIPFQALIGGPLVAAIDAQGLSAAQSLRFILSVLYGQDMLSGYDDFGGKVGGGYDEVLNVELIYSVGNQTASVTVPLLVLVPIPYISIDVMTVNFTADINATSTFTSSASDSTYAHGSGSDSFGFFGFDFKMAGGYSSKKSSVGTAKSKYSVEYTIDVYVHAVNDDMPAGTATVLNLLNKSLQTQGY